MANLVQGIFTRPIFTGDKQTQQRKAAEGLSQVFATILARQMRETMTGGEQGQGPLGIGGGAGGSIYGSFMDDAMSKLLAHSPAMQPLNHALERAMAGQSNSITPAPTGKIRVLGRFDRVLFSAAIHDETAVPLSHSSAPTSPIEARDEASTDALGPRILPPPPDGMAPNLPPPFPLEG